MAKMSGKHLAAIVAIGAALSFGVGAALAAEDVTEDQILKALAPSKKPLTRGLSAGPQADPAASGAWWFWLAADNLRLPAANAVKLAEKLLE